MSALLVKYVGIGIAAVAVAAVAALYGHEELPAADPIAEQELKCPISLEVMTEPVTAPCGHSFEKVNIYQQLQIKKECPMCRERLQME
jgi:hypothetical protein